ncbi:MAG: PIN domain-containing protein [Bacteroidales bacterium]|nr:PIN domain-containing protein [Bacteroidales bacterium]
MRAFLDTNVLLDSILDRDDRQFCNDAAVILKMGRNGVLELFMSILSIPTIAYVIKNVNAERKRAIIQDITSIVKVLPALPEHVSAMLESPLSDIEDSLQLLSAKEGACDIIVTRDLNGFQQSDIPAICPADLLSRILD